MFLVGEPILCPISYSTLNLWVPSTLYHFSQLQRCISYYSSNSSHCLQQLLPQRPTTRRGAWNRSFRGRPPLLREPALLRAIRSPHVQSLGLSFLRDRQILGMKVCPIIDDIGMTAGFGQIFGPSSRQDLEPS